MKIISWNILADEFVKKKYYKEFDIVFLHNRLERIKRIVKRITDENCSIILLQEVMNYEYEYIKRHFTNYYFSPLCNINWSQKSESGNVTMFKKTIFSANFTNNKIIYKKKVFGLQTILYLKNNPHIQINIFNIHLNDSYWQIRVAQLNIIKDLVMYMKYVIIAGDFNQNYSSNNSMYLIPKFITHNKTVPTYFIEKYINIDNILTKGFSVNYSGNNSINNIQLIPKQQLIYLFASDHLPVITNVII
jgi:endonuclease/exonuclease/phosphatase family metal-dependent hydrolase